MKALHYETKHSLTVSSETPNKKRWKVPSDRVLITWKGKTAFWQNKAYNRKHGSTGELSHKKLYTSPQAKVLCWLAKSAEVFSNGDGPTLSNCATTLVTTGLPIIEVPKLLWVFSMRLVVGCVGLAWSRPLGHDNLSSTVERRRACDQDAVQRANGSEYFGNLYDWGTSGKQGSNTDGQSEPIPIKAELSLPGLPAPSLST